MSDLLNAKVRDFYNDVKAITIKKVVALPLSKEAFKAATGLNNLSVERWYSGTVKSLSKYGILNTEDMAMFIAQIGHESGGFSRIIESFNYSKTGLRDTFGKRLTEAQILKYGRKDNERIVPTDRQEAIANIVYGGRMGNTLPGDGWSYRGRGLMQLTGKNNYGQFSNSLEIDFIRNPAGVASDDNAVLSAGWFWYTNNCNGKKGDVLAVTKIINGGTNGLKDRQVRYDRAIKALK